MMSYVYHYLMTVEAVIDASRPLPNQPHPGLVSNDDILTELLSVPDEFYEGVITMQGMIDTDAKYDILKQAVMKKHEVDAPIKQVRIESLSLLHSIVMHQTVRGQTHEADQQ